MASRRRQDAPGAAAIHAGVGGGAGEVVRRAPFADNPRVGARGQRTQQLILDAALKAFGEEGYDICSIDSITRRADCSRASFYQYFSSKEDVFRHLTGQAARALDASTDALEPLTPDASGWRALRAWLARHADIYGRYEPLFHAFQAASESDDAVATGGMRWRLRTVAKLHARIVGSAVGPRELDPVIVLLLECVSRTHDVARLLRSAAAGYYTEDRVGDALADVLHRTLFGLRKDVNVHRAAPRRPPVLRFDPVIRDAFSESDAPAELTSSGRQTRDALMSAGRKTFVEHGYHRTLVGDVADAAGVSRAGFYRYFENKDQLARALTARAMRTVSRVLGELPATAAQRGAAGRTALRRWLRRYNRTQADEAAMLRVWVDAALQDATLRAASAPALDWGRRALVSFLERRGFGDIEVEAVVLVALLSAFGARRRTPAEVNATARIVAQGFLGLRGR
jgi:AcrR family transcriptional regulator